MSTATVFGNLMAIRPPNDMQGATRIMGMEQCTLTRSPIVIIMDGSCIAQIFPSRKFKALAHTIHANIHTDINMI